MQIHLAVDQLLPAFHIGHKQISCNVLLTMCEHTTVIHTHVLSYYAFYSLFWTYSIQLSLQFKGRALRVSHFPELSVMLCKLFI